MTLREFALRGEYIELNALLKALGLAPSGAAAGALVTRGAVTVDGATETRIRRKLRAGQIVRLGTDEIHVTAGLSPSAANPP